MIETIILIAFLGGLWVTKFFTSSMKEAEFSPPYGDFRMRIRADSKFQRRLIKFLACFSVAVYVVYELFIISVDSLGAVFLGA
ncbi:MAG: hypothetical protein ACOH5I_09810 [Oligoflexus sp.]